MMSEASVFTTFPNRFVSLMQLRSPFAATKKEIVYKGFHVNNKSFGSAEFQTVTCAQNSTAMCFVMSKIQKKTTATNRIWTVRVLTSLFISDVLEGQ